MMSAFSLPNMHMPAGGSSFGGFQKHRYGDAGVHYDADGRLTYGQQPTTYPRRYDDDDDRRSYDARREQRRSQYRDNDGYDGYDDNAYPTAERRYQPRPPPAYSVDTRKQFMIHSSKLSNRQGPTGYPTTLQQARSVASGTPSMVPYRPTVQPIQEYRPPQQQQQPMQEYYGGPKMAYVQQEPWGTRPTWLVFILAGVAMLIMGLLNILFCEHWHHYFRFWTGLVIMELGIVGGFHRGNYFHRWQNWHYMLSSVLAMILSFVGCALLLDRLAPQIINMASIEDTDAYIELMKMQDLDSVVDVSTETKVWVCLAVDCTTQLLLFAGMAALAAGSLVAEKFWKNNYPVYGTMSPFCLPWLFNSYSQMLLSEVVAFMGLVTVYSCLDNHDTDTQWQDYWGPVWAAGIAAVAGGFTVAAIKREDMVCLSALALVWQLLSLLASVAAFYLCIRGILENVDMIDISVDGSFQEKWATASAVLLALANLLLLINFFYSSHAIYRLIRSISNSIQSRRPDPHQGNVMGPGMGPPMKAGYGDDRWYNNNGWSGNQGQRY